jgi:hypothetical protein
MDKFVQRLVSYIMTEPPYDNCRQVWLATGTLYTVRVT